MSCAYGSILVRLVSGVAVATPTATAPQSASGARAPLATGGSIGFMSAEPISSGTDVEGLDEQMLSMVALLGALASAPNWDKLRDLSRTSPVIHDQLMRLATSLAGSGDEPEPRLRHVGRARKISVSMPEDLTAAVQQRVGRGEFSQYVTEAVTRQLELDLLGELSALLQAEHGPVSEEALAEARRSWPDAK